MSHVTDGDLHAYLDGALDLYPAGEARRIRSHLESCGECRGRLQEEERLRERAASVLGRTGPTTVDIPPFEDLRRRTAAGSSASGTGGGRAGLAVRLGWAASVLVALGMGWVVGRERATVSEVQPAPTVSAAAERPSAGMSAAADPPSPEAGADAAESERMAVGPEAGVVRGAGDRVEEAEGAVASAAPAASPAQAEAEPEVQRTVSRERDVAGDPRQIRRDTLQAATVAAASAGLADSARGGVVDSVRAATVDSVGAEEAGTITGRAVRDRTGAPLVGAQVMVEGTSVGAVTDEEGRYVLEPVPAGTRTLRLRSIGYETVTETVTVKAGGIEVVDLASPVAPHALDGLVVSGAGATPPDSIQRAERRSDSIAIAPTTFETARRDTSASRELERRREAPGEGGDPVRTLRLPGLEVLEVGWTEVAPGVEGLLVVQALAGDTTRLELRFGGLDRRTGAGDASAGRAADEAAATADPAPETPVDTAGPPAVLLEESLPEGVAQAAARLSGGTGWVVLRGRLPEERLRRLLDLLR